MAVGRRAGLAVSLLLLAGTLRAQERPTVEATHDSVRLQFVDTDLRAVIQSLGRYLPKPVIVGSIQASRVSLETPGAVDRQRLVTLLRGLVESQGLQFAEDSAYFTVNPRPAPPPYGSVPAAAPATSAGPIQLFVIRLAHARAADVAATVNQLFGGTGEFAGTRGTSTGTLSDELRRNIVPPVAAPAASAPVSPRGASLAGAVTIVPDELTNSLLVRAASTDFELIRSAIDQLDIRPLQVLIEVLIVEARRDRNFALGMNLSLPPQGLGHGPGTVDATVSGASLGDFVVRLLKVGHAQFDAALSAAASRGDVQIMSRPVLLASNNTEARMLVGSQRPFIQVSRSLPTETPTRDQVVEYRDVGTKLTVRPTINQDGYVSLAIQQEVNSATSETAFDAPVISTREASTQVLVRDGQTIVLGGLRDTERDVTHGGIPLLSSLPLIGGLFGSSTRTSNDTEFYLFLTPRILRTDADADSVTTPRLPTVPHS